MARIMDTISNPDEVWEIKDDLDILNQDPMKMNMRTFKRYLEAKKRERLEHHLRNGLTDKQCIAHTRKVLLNLDRKWREAAKAHNEALAKEQA